MNTTGLLAAALTLAIGTGVLLVVLGLTPRPAPPIQPYRARSRTSAFGRLLGLHLPDRERRRRQALLAGFAVAGVAVWATTGFVLAVVLLPAATLGLPVLLASAPSTTTITRLDALEQWVRGLSGKLNVGAGIESAIIASAGNCPPAVRAPVQLLAARLTAGWNTERALRVLADDLDDATADVIAASLILAARRRGTGLVAVLDDLSDTVAEEVRMRRAIETDRAKPRARARFVTGVATGVTVIAFATGFFAPYTSGVGQLVFLFLVGLFIACLLWLRGVGRSAAAPRFLPATGPTMQPLATPPAGPPTRTTATPITRTATAGRTA